MTPVTLSLPPIFPLLLLLILHDENRQIAIHCMCRHATGDVAADNADRRAKWFFNWHWVKILTYSSLPLIPISFIWKGFNRFISNCPLTFFDIFHALKPPSSSSSSSTTSYPVALPDFPDFSETSGKGNHNNISPETQSIFFLDIFKARQRILKPKTEAVEIVRERVCV